MIFGNSIKKQILSFGLFLSILFIVQIYMIVDPNHITGSGLDHYGQSIEQDKLLKDLANMVDRSHELVQDISYETEEAISNIMEMDDTINTHVERLKTLGPSDEWKSAYQTLRDLHDAYSAGIKSILVSAKSFDTLKGTLTTKSVKPIVDILEEVKSFAQKPQEQTHLQSLIGGIHAINTYLVEILAKPSYKAQDFEALNKPMESVTITLAALLPLTDHRPDFHGEIERFQTLVINYFSAIHQMKDHLLERPKLVDNLLQQEKLFVNFINDLTLALKENQKEVFQDVYKESKGLKRNSLLSSAMMMLMVILFLMILLFKVQRPLTRLATVLTNINAQERDSFKKSFQEIQDILEAVDALKNHIAKELRTNFQTTLKEDNQRIESKLNMLASSAVELGKVSADIAKIPTIFDKKFTSIYMANDESRIHFRHMVHGCEEMHKTLETLIKQVEKNPAKVSKKTLDSLKESLAHVLSLAHEGAVESQTLGLRFNSLLRTKDDTLEVAKLFSKAGSRVNQLARSLKEDVSLFFEKIQGEHLPEEENPLRPDRPSL